MDEEIGAYSIDDAVAPLKRYLDTKVDLGVAHLADDQFDTLIENRREELLTLALCDIRTADCDKAFMLLCKPLKKIVHLLTYDNLFYLHCGAVLQSHCSDISIGRIACMVKEIVRSGITMCDLLYDLMMNLLKHSGNSGVLDLYTSILVNQDLFDKYPKKRKETLKTVLLSEIRDAKDNETLTNLLVILRYVLKNKHVKDTFLNHETVDTVAVITSNEDLFVKNALWFTLTSLCAPETVAYMSSLLAVSVIITAEPFEKPHMYHIYMLDFMCKFILSDAKSFSQVMPSVTQILCRLMLQFPDCSNLQGAILRLIQGSMCNDRLFSQMLHAVLPLLAHLAQSEHRGAASAFSTFLLTDLAVKRYSNNVINRLLTNSSDYKECNENYLTKYLKILQHKYGGELEVREKVQKRSGIEVAQLRKAGKD